MRGGCCGCVLLQVEKGPAKPHFPDVYREFESLQGQVRKMAQEYICNPQGMNTALEVRNIEVRFQNKGTHSI